MTSAPILHSPAPMNNLLQNKKSRYMLIYQVLSMARLRGFEPLAYGLEVRCSIQLSYRRIF